MRRVIALSLLGFVACASVRNGGTFDGGADASVDAGDGDDDAGTVGDASRDAATKKDSGSKRDASVVDAAIATDAHVAFDATGGVLDPDLKLPSTAGAACSTPGSEMGCPLASVCRIASAAGGRCESCSNCGNLNALCNASDQCDILFQCFQGHCTNFCHLGTSECGAINDCVDVGHPTLGMCLP